MFQGKIVQDIVVKIQYISLTGQINVLWVMGPEGAYIFIWIIHFLIQTEICILQNNRSNHLLL